jgi:hypothetical protein
MSVPSDQLMQMMQSQRDSATPGGMPPIPDMPSAMSDSSTAPAGAPMSTPEPKMGNREAAMINVGMAIDLLEQSLPAIGSESDEGRKVLAAIRSMSEVIGPRKGKTNELQQSEILQMLQTLPQAGGATPEGKAMSQAPAISGMPPGMGMPPPPPGGGMPMPGGLPGQPPQPM